MLANTLTASVTILTALLASVAVQYSELQAHKIRIGYGILNSDLQIYSVVPADVFETFTSVVKVVPGSVVNLLI